MIKNIQDSPQIRTEKDGATTRPAKGWRTALKIVLGIGFVVFLLYKIDPQRIWDTAKAADRTLLLIPLALLPLNIAVETAIWRSVTEQLEINISWKQMLDAVMAGFSLGAVTPARVGEFAGRAYFLPKDERWKGALALAISRQPELAVLGFAGCVGLFAFMNMVPDAPAPLAGVLGIGFIATVFVALVTLRPAILKPLTRRFGKYVSVFPGIELADELDRINLRKTLVLSSVRYIVFCAQFIVLAMAFGIQLSGVLMAAVVASIMLVRFVIPPITFMDLGIREGASVFFFGLAGASEAGAFNAALMLFAINIALPALLGMYSIRRIGSQPEEEEHATL